MKLKVVVRIMLMLLLVSAFCATLNITPVAAHPTVRKVPDDYPTIQDAINAASDYDIIHVRAGTYVQTANLFVDKPLTLIGEDRTTTIIDLSGSWTVHLYADGIVIMEFTIQNGYLWGILADSDNTIKDNHIVACYEGGICLGGSYNQIIGNTIELNSWYGGIWLSGSATHNIIKANNITMNDWGLWIENDAHDNEIYYNNFMDNLAGHVASPNDPLTVQTWDDGVLNKGNYWDDYTGSGPYVIDTYNQDNFPLWPSPWAHNPGDINYDGRVNIVDIVIAVFAFGSQWCTKDSRWNPQADINNDLKVNIVDLVIIGVNFGWIDC